METAARLFWTPWPHNLPARCSPAWPPSNIHSAKVVAQVGQQHHDETRSLHRLLWVSDTVNPIEVETPSGCALTGSGGTGWTARFDWRNTNRSAPLCPLYSKPGTPTTCELCCPGASLGAVYVGGRPVSCSGVSTIHLTCSVFCSWERTKSLRPCYHVSIAAMIDSKHGFCLWGTAVCTTLSSRCLRGLGRVPSAVLPASLFVGNSRLRDAVLPLFEGAQPRTQRRPPCFSFPAPCRYSAVACLLLRRAASR